MENRSEFTQNEDQFRTNRPRQQVRYGAPDDSGGSKKSLVEDSIRIRSWELAKAGVFESPFGSQWVLEAQRGANEIGKLAVVSLVQQYRPLISVEYAVPVSGHRHKRTEVVVPLEATKPAVGGVRWYFCCPGLDGKPSCGRRVQVLYVPMGDPRVACRSCHGLTYSSRQRHGSNLYEYFIKPYWQRKQGRRRARRPEQKIVDQAIDMVMSGLLASEKERPPISIRIIPPLEFRDREATLHSTAENPNYSPLRST